MFCSPKDSLRWVTGAHEFGFMQTYSTALWAAETGGYLDFLTTSLVRDPAPRNMTEDIYMM